MRTKVLILISLSPLNPNPSQLFCNFCYKDRFGPSGIGFGTLSISRSSN